MPNFKFRPLRTGILHGTTAPRPPVITRNMVKGAWAPKLLRGKLGETGESIEFSFLRGGRIMY
jgi:hypothetical protein